MEGEEGAVHDPRFPAGQPLPSSDAFTWARVRERFLPLYLARVAAGPSILRTFTNPKKKYLNTPREIISFHSLHASEAAWRLLSRGLPPTEDHALHLLSEIYASALRHELELSFELYTRFLKRLPSFTRFRQVVFLARYEADGPSGSPEREAEHQLAHRFFESARMCFYGPEGARQMAGNVYTATWQVGDYIERYEFQGMTPGSVR